MRVSQQLTRTLREVPRDSEGGNKESRIVPLLDAVRVIQEEIRRGMPEGYCASN